MTTISLHFNLHQPVILKEFGILRVDNYTDYADALGTHQSINELVNNYVFPVNKMLRERIKKSKGKLIFSLSISGTTLELFEQYRKDALISFKKLLQTGAVQIVSQSFYHSQASSFWMDEYQEQLRQFDQYIYNLFRQFPIPSKTAYHHSTGLSCQMSCKDCKKQKSMKLFVDYRLFETIEKLQSFSQKLDTMLYSDEFEFSLDASSPAITEEAEHTITNTALLQRIYRIANLVLLSNNQSLIKWWRRLQDISYYGFNSVIPPTEEIYIRNILASIEVILIKQHLAKRKPTFNQRSYLL